MPYRVVGIMEPTGTVLDRLALTPLDSVWHIHGHGEHHSEGHSEEGHRGEGDDHREDGDRAITALLISYSSPMAAVILPNQINSSTAMQAASPSYEVARLNRFVGAGTDIMQSIAWFLVVLAGLSIFAGLYSVMDERRYDLALMRSFGAGPLKLVFLIVAESLLMALLGLVAGVVVGHGLVEWIGTTVETARHLHVSGRVLLVEEIWLAALALGIGVLAAVIPAIRVYRIDIYRTLVQR
jgi:putative ABC transport system permease protein